MMNYRASFASYGQDILLSNSLKLIRRLSAQVAASFKPSDDEFAKAIPFEEIPGLSKFDLMRRFLPGGKFHNASIIDIQQGMQNEFGDFNRMPGIFGQKDVLTVYDPEVVKFVFRNEGTYPYRRGLDTMEHFRKNIRSDVYSVGGLIIEQGEEWYKMRTVVNPIMMQPRLVRYYIPTIDSIVNGFFSSIPKILDDNCETPANFNEYLNRWSLESITAVALEKRLGLMDFENPQSVGVRIAKAVRKILNLGLEFEMKPSIWRFYETKEFKELMEAYNELTDLSAMIIDEAVERYDKGEFNDGERDQGILFKLLQKDKRFATVMAFDMIFAGIDTTSSALCFMIYNLAKNPDKQEKLREELMSILPEKDTPLTGDNMKQLPYLRAVIKESLRLYPPAMVNSRRTTENLVIRGYQVPKDVDIMMGMLHIYRNEAYFGSPTQFVPERWLRQPQDETVCPHSMKQSHPFSYLPFGFGSRFCAGKRIAEMEIEVFMSRLFRNYKVEWHHSDLKMKATLVVIPDGDLKFKMIKL